MSEEGQVDYKQQLDQANHMLKICNAKLSAANQSLGATLGQSNDIQAANILYQEREKELMSRCQELEFKCVCLEKKIVELEDELAALKKPTEPSDVPPVGEPEQNLAQEQQQGDHFEL